MFHSFANSKLAPIYYNEGNLSCLGFTLMSHCLACKISQLDKIIGHLNHIDTRRMNNVKYRRLSIDSYGSVWFTQMKLQNDDVRIMFSIFGQYSSKGLIELDTPLVTSFNDILECLIRPRIYEEIRACMEIRYEEFSLTNL